MSFREDFLNTLNHKQPDRMVIDFGSTNVTGIHVKAVENLRIHYGLEQKPVLVTDPSQMLGEVDQELAEILGVGVKGAFGRKNAFGFDNTGPVKEYLTPWGQTLLVPEGFCTTTDAQGDVLMYPEGDVTANPSAKMPRSGYFFDSIIRQQPIEEDKLDPADNLEEYGPISDADLDYWRETTQKARATGKAVIAGFGGTALGDIAHIPGKKLKHPKGIRDITEWYLSILIRPGYIKAVFEQQTEIALENLARIAAAVGDNVDAVYLCGADFGTQESTFCSPEQFDDLWFPYYRKMNDWIHSHTSWKTFKHSCGAIESFMPRFIEAGFDIINPVQLNARGMDPVQLKSKYGKEIVFWGGGVDTQQTLPYATPEKVREEVLRLCEIFHKDGGFVFSTVHNIQANVPVENMVAMMEAIREFNG